MSIINEALKKAASRRSELLIDELISDSSGGTAEVLQAGTVQDTWQKKKRFIFSTIGGGVLAGAVALALFMGINSIPQKEIIPQDELAPVAMPIPIQEASVIEPILPKVGKRKKFVKLPDLNLSGITRGRGKSMAIINDRIVNVGDSIRGASVVMINDNSVVLVYEDHEFILRLK